MALDSSTLKEIEGKVRAIRSDYEEKSKIANANKQQLAVLYGNDIYEKNRELCVCRCLIDEVPDGPYKKYVIYKIAKTSEVIYEIIKLKAGRPPQNPALWKEGYFLLNRSRLNNGFFPASIIPRAFFTSFSTPASEDADPTCTVFTTLFPSL